MPRGRSPASRVEMFARVVRLFRRPAQPPVAAEVEVRPKPPADPIELGFLLRTNREKSGLSLDQLRDMIGVPVVDLDALERGEFERLHTQQAAVIALWRYGERLGLEPSELVGVLRTHWPNRGLSVDAFVSRRGITPMAELQSASRLLLPISAPQPLASRPLGLSDETKRRLADGSAKRLFALRVLAPTTAVRRARLAEAPEAVAALGPAPLAAPPAEESEVNTELFDAPRALNDAEVIAEFVATTASAPPIEADDPVSDEVNGAADHPARERDEYPSVADEHLGEAGIGEGIDEAQLVDGPHLDGDSDEVIEDTSSLAAIAVAEDEAAEAVEPQAVVVAAGAPADDGVEAVASFPSPQVAPRSGVTAESQRTWARHFAHFLSTRLGLDAEASAEAAGPGPVD